MAVDATTDLDRLRLILDGADLASASLASWISEEATQNLEFSECVPLDLVQAEMAQRTRDDAAVRRAVTADGRRPSRRLAAR